MYVVQPSGAELWFGQAWKEKGASEPEGYVYNSGTNQQWLDVEGIMAFIKPIEEELAKAQI